MFSPSRKTCGSLDVTIGPMFSGKTTKLNYTLTDKADNGYKVIKIVHQEDVRANSESGSTHNSSYTGLSPKIVVVKTGTLSNIDVSLFSIIGVDETNFFEKEDLLSTIEYWVEVLGKHVYVSGLCGSSNRKAFGHILDLIPMADKVLKLRATCKKCLEEQDNTDFHNNIFCLEAPFTKRTINVQDEKLVGAGEYYIPVCRYHFSN